MMALMIPQRMEKQEAPRINGTATSDWKYSLPVAVSDIKDVSIVYS
jgi:hypothetical protein